MALKTKNYEVKNLGIIIPEAYAIIKDIRISGEYGTARIVIQQTRELALEKAPLEQVDIGFVVNRNENPYATAYLEAKKDIKKEVELPNGEVRIITIKGQFADWEDDIVTQL